MQLCALPLCNNSIHLFFFFLHSTKRFFVELASCSCSVPFRTAHSHAHFLVVNSSFPLQSCEYEISDSFLMQLQLILYAAVCQTGYSCLLFFSLLFVLSHSNAKAAFFPVGAGATGSVLFILPERHSSFVQVRTRLSHLLQSRPIKVTSVLMLGSSLGEWPDGGCWFFSGN